MKKVRATFCVAVVIQLITASQGFGYVEYKDGVTHNISSVVNDDVRVDHQAPGTQTTVNLLAGASLPWPYAMLGYNDSRINFAGGTVGNKVLISGACQLTLFSGHVGHYISANDNCQMTISGGTVGGDIGMRDSCSAIISGGTIGGGLWAGDFGNIAWSGGTLVGSISLRENAILTIAGSGFAIDGVAVGLGEITSILGGTVSSEPARALTGTLANGGILNNQFQIGDDASIVLIPEPATLLLLGLGAIAMRFRRT